MSVRNEAAFWAKVRDALNAGAPAWCVSKLPGDGYAGAGLPDALYCVEGCVGVLELKYAPAWPKRAATEVPVGHGLTPEQRRWLERWALAGGRGHVLLGVADEWFLLEPHEVPASNKIGRTTLDAIARLGRSGPLKGLDLLPGMLVSQLNPVGID